MITLAQEGFFSFSWWQWLMIIILIGLIVLFFVLRRGLTRSDNGRAPSGRAPAACVLGRGGSGVSISRFPSRLRRRRALPVEKSSGTFLRQD